MEGMRWWFRLLQRIGCFQGKIWSGWTLDFGNSKIWHAYYEVGVLLLARNVHTVLAVFAIQWFSW